MNGVTDFTAVINPPQAAILAVGELARPGRSSAEATEFLARIRALLERPLALVY